MHCSFTFNIWVFLFNLPHGNSYCSNVIGLIIISLQVNAADTIIVHKDPRIDVLTAKQIAINKVTVHIGSNGLFKGYRLQVLNTRSRDEAFKTKTMLLRKFS